MGLLSPALHEVSLVRAVRIAVAQRKHRSAVDVDVVRAVVSRTAVRIRGALAVVVEFRVFDQHRPDASQNPVLVVVKRAIAHDKTITLVANSGAILTRS